MERNITDKQQGSQDLNKAGKFSQTQKPGADSSRSDSSRSDMSRSDAGSQASRTSNTIMPEDSLRRPVGAQDAQGWQGQDPKGSMDSERIQDPRAEDSARQKRAQGGALDQDSSFGKGSQVRDSQTEVNQPKNTQNQQGSKLNH